MTKLEWLIIRTKPVQFSFKIMKKIVLPGFGKLTLYEVLNFFINELKKNSLTDRAAAVTFNFLMAIPPTLLFLFTLRIWRNQNLKAYHLTATIAFMGITCYFVDAFLNFPTERTSMQTMFAFSAALVFAPHFLFENKPTSYPSNPLQKALKENE